MEVMGLMLGEFVDDYTVRVVDVFAMPQSGTGVSVEAVDPVFQTKMLDMLKQCGRQVRGTGLGGACSARSWGACMLACMPIRALALLLAGRRWWLAGTTATPDLGAGSREWTSTHSRWGRATHIPVPCIPPFSLTLSLPHTHTSHTSSTSSTQSFEALNQRAVAVVVDPVQSVKGKVVIDAFRLISPQTMMLGQEPRQTTSNLGHLNKPSIQALIHGLNRHYYSIAINYR
jgi:hypothetical protein